MDALSPATNFSLESVSELFANGVAGGVNSLRANGVIHVGNVADRFSERHIFGSRFEAVLFRGHDLGRRHQILCVIVELLRTLSVSGFAEAFCALAIMGAAKQIATRQINRFIPVFSFWITRSWQHTTDGGPVQADGLA